MSDQSAVASPIKPVSRYRTAILVGAALAIGLMTGVVTSSYSQSAPMTPLWRHGHAMGGPIDPAKVQERADRMVRHMAVDLDASADQQAKLQAIVKSALTDLLPLHEKAQAARRQGRDLLTQATIDRAALEKLRADQIASMDAGSKRLTQALADAAEVLTPDQRRKLNDMLESHRGHGWGFWRHGHRG